MPCTTRGACMRAVSVAAPMTRSRTRVSLIHINAVSLDGGAARGGAVGELLAVGEGDLLQQRRRFAVPQRRDDGRDLVAGLDHVELPPGAVEDAGARALDEPVPLLAGPGVRGI